MATKFKRDSDVKFDWNVRGRTAENTRRRTLMRYAGLGILFIFIFALQYLGGNLGEWSEAKKGRAQVLKKIIQGEETDSASYSIECAIHIPNSLNEGDTLSLSENVRTDPLSWKAVREGDVINVTYRMKEDYSAIRIETIALGMNIILNAP